MIRKVVLLLALAMLSSFVFAQTNLPDIGIQSNLALGNVKATGEQKIVLETKDGVIDVVIQSVTQFKRLPPDNLKLSAATDAKLADIAVGDRLLVTGKVSDDRKSIYSNKIFLVKGSDLQAQAEKQRREWQMRGIAGRVEAIDPAAQSITVKTSGVGARTISLTPKEGAKFLRYSKTSARYSDAVEGTFESVAVGDTLQALGDRSQDGSTFAAEEILTGSFVTVAGAVKGIDLEKREVTIADLGTKQDVTVVVSETTLMKEFPEQMAQRLAMFLAMRGTGGPRPGGRGRPAGGGGGQERPRGQGGGGRPGGRRGMGDLNQIANRLPTIQFSDIKVGDQVAVSSPKPDDSSRYTAIKLFSGIGPFLVARPASGGRGRGRSLSTGITIPGLEGADF